MYIDVLGHKVRYYEEGNGKNLLLIHGLGGSLDSFVNNKELARDFHLIALDLLGFGFSSKPRIRYSISMYTKFIRQFLDSLNIDEVSIVGSSLGGQIAAEFAIRYPSIINKLILVSPAGVTPYSFKGSKELKLYMSIFDAKDKEDLKNRLNDASEEYLNFMYDYIRMENAKYAFYSALKNSAKAPRLYDRLDKIKALTMVIWGKEDKIIPVRYSKPFIAMKNCRLILLEGCEHRPHYEKPRLFNSLVKDFVNDIK